MFNNRELATLVWLTFFSIWVFRDKGIRSSVLNLFQAFVAPKILLCLGAMAAYTATVVAGLYAIGFWQPTMIKDTIMWFCFGAFATVMRFMTSGEDKDIFRKIFWDNVKLVLLLEFLIGFYVFPFLVELIFVPFVTLLALMDVFLKHKDEEEYRPAAKLITFLLGIVGLLLIAFVLYRAVNDFRNLGTVDTFRSLAFPPVMSILFAPFIYLLVVVDAYERFFIRLRLFLLKDPNLVRYAKRRILLHCGLSLKKIKSLAKIAPMELPNIRSAKDVDQLLTSA